MRLQIISPSTSAHDAIAAHSGLLADALRSCGVDAAFVDGRTAQVLAEALARRSDWLVVAYNPYSFGRWGFAPQLVLAALLARLVPRAPRMALMVHEAYSPERSSMRNRLMGLWQREQLRLLVALSSRVFGSTEHNCGVARRLVPGARPVHLPISSTIPCGAVEGAQAREAVGAREDELVVVVLGGRHPTRLLVHVEAALAGLDAAGVPHVLLNLGADPPDLRVPERTRVLTPGPLGANALSVHLRSGDVCLLPFTDGVSTRRTTLAAALDHGLPIVATEGPATEEVLRRARDALMLVPVDARDAFAEAVVALADDPLRRARMGTAARALYRRELGWPLVCARLTAALEETG